MTKSFDKERAHDTFYKMIQTDRKHRCVLESFLSSFGIHRSQHMVLLHLAKEDYPSQKALAEHFKISPAAIAVTLRKLEQSGFIEREAGKDDCRLNSISLTAKGKGLVEKSKELFDETDYAMFKDFTDEEYDVFCSCLNKMMNGLTEYSESTK